MRSQTEHVLQKLFSETSIDNISVDRLKQLIDEHPYFTLGHLVLARKLQTINATEYEAQSEKASLFFSEPIWLQSLLQPADELGLTIKQIRREETASETAHPEPFHAEETHEHHSLDQPFESEIILPPAKDTLGETDQASLDLPEHHTEQEQVFTENEHQPHTANVAEEEAEPVNAAKEEAPQIFEPYHTIDYFASQGIRVSTEIKPDDRLAQQLRSFTDWLKTMKRLPETKVEAQLDEVTQQNIQEFAAHSLDEKEVVTESMAEVLVKQNRDAEAVEIYEKLSLLNPSKRAYFAAKIEQLKGS